MLFLGATWSFNLYETPAGTGREDPRTYIQEGAVSERLYIRDLGSASLSGNEGWEGWDKPQRTHCFIHSHWKMADIRAGPGELCKEWKHLMGNLMEVTMQLPLTTCRKRLGHNREREPTTLGQTDTHEKKTKRVRICKTQNNSSPSLHSRTRIGPLFTAWTTVLGTPVKLWVLATLE